MSKAKIEKKNVKKKKVEDKSKVVKRKLYAKTDSKKGAKSKFDEFNEEIIARARSGCSIKDRIGGLIVQSTYCEWINAGDEDLRNEVESQYSNFSKKIKEAENEFRETLRSVIKQHAANDWKAGAWLLERSDPESYKLKDKVEMNSTVEVSQKAILEIPDNGRRTIS